ncbi:MAG: hypothetical protein Q4G39_01110 [Brachymonas sp.]|nr:hypothetical protein [Brachymonas sp.]
MSTLDASLDAIMEIDGAIAVAVFDFAKGAVLGERGEISLRGIASGVAALVQAKGTVMKGLNMNENMEDGMFTLETQYHLVKPVYSKSAVIYAIFDKNKSMLALVRRGLQDVAASIA